jgi:iron complex outermembrane receptor protein
MIKKSLVIFFLGISLSSFSQALTDTINICEVTVTGSYSAAKQTPFTFQNLTPKEISVRSMGTEPAVLLSYTPSINFYSDNGTGLGYMYYRLRGIDQTRINSTLNGIPLNEPEDQGIYYNNYGGFLNAISNIQLIRGAGLSKPGVSSYGGSINYP